MSRAQDSTARARLDLALQRATTATAAALALAACTTRGAPVEAPIDLTVAPLAADAGASLTPRPTTSCTVRLRAGRIDKSSPGCVLDEQISSNAGTLTYPCSGNGPAEAVFGKQRYSGVVVNGDVELTLETELDWEDGCRWGTRAIIKGTLLTIGSTSELTSKPLAWTYRDTVITGTDCSGACTARSSFQVQHANGSAVQPPDEHEEDGD